MARTDPMTEPVPPVNEAAERNAERITKLLREGRSGASVLVVEVMTRDLGGFIQYPRNGITEEWIALGDIMTIADEIAAAEAGDSQ